MRAIRCVLACLILMLSTVAQAQSPTIPGLLTSVILNDTVTGTTVNKLAKLTAGKVIIAATTDTDGVIGVVLSGAGLSGSAQVVTDGVATCAFDGTATAGDYVQISASVAGDCTDTTSSTRPATGQVIGRVITGGAGAGSYKISLQIGAPGFTFGTGVITALGVNVGSAGSVLVNGGVLGTPSSGTATNLSGTAASLTAGHVTTNANLTGDVTSVGNASTAVKVNGVAYSASPSTDTVPVVTAANTATYTALSNCNTGIYLQYNTSTHLFTCGTLPYFSAYPSVASTTVTTSVSTKMAINTKVSDSNVWYDAVTNFRFTPLLAGKYSIHVQVTCNGTTVSACVGQIYKNGANYAQQQINGSAASQGANANTIITFNGTTDFVEAFVLVVCTGTCGYTGGTAPEQTLFEASYIGP